ncbi:MAG: 30S ribosomal protein S17 [Candidatus Omnitrophota bacterium]
MDKQSHRKQRVGVVVSDKMDKTRVVKVQRTMSHPVYKKIIKKSNRFKVHDEKNTSKTGDRVRIMETRPLSKDKRWRLIEVITS